MEVIAGPKRRLSASIARAGCTGSTSSSTRTSPPSCSPGGPRADALLMLTDVPEAQADKVTPDARPLSEVGPTELGPALRGRLDGTGAAADAARDPAQCARDARDGGALWLRSGVCGGWGTRKGTQLRLKRTSSAAQVASGRSRRLGASAADHRR